VVYPVTDESIACDPLPIPSFWRQIGGLDLGGSGEEGHPTAAVKMAHDPEADIVYITATYRKKGGPIYEHAAALREWGADLPWAWPADALQHERKSGEQIKQMFLGHGLNMLSEFAEYEDGSTGLEASVEKIYERMLTGRWKVFRHLNDYFNEFGMYHRKDGAEQTLALIRRFLFACSRPGMYSGGVGVKEILEQIHRLSEAGLRKYEGTEDGELWQLATEAKRMERFIRETATGINALNEKLSLVTNRCERNLEMFERRMAAAGRKQSQGPKRKVKK
jgi:hypothetical protein